MKTITLSQFETLVSDAEAWTRTQEIEVTEHTTRPNQEMGEDGELLENDINHTYGWAQVVSERDGIVIKYTEGFNYDDNEPDTFNASTEGQDTVWEIEAIVIDEDGDEVEAHDLADYIEHDEFRDVDYSGLQILEVEEVDEDEGEGEGEDEIMEVASDNSPNLRFKGSVIGFASSHTFNNDVRWTELRLCKTTGGKFVCEIIGQTRWQDERTRCKAEVCETIEQVKAFFGYGWLAKELYEDAGIDAAIEVK